MLLRHSAAGPLSRSCVAMRVPSRQKPPSHPTGCEELSRAPSAWCGLEMLGCDGEGMESALEAGDWMAERGSYL